MLRKLIKICLLVAGTLFAMAPAIAVHFSLLNNAQNQGDELVNSIATTMIARADQNVTSALNSLSDFVLLGVNSCASEDIAVMRKVAYEQFWIKEIGIADRTGALLCDQFGMPVSFQEISPDLKSNDDNVSIRVVKREGRGENEAMVSWKLDTGNSLVAILPGEALADDVIPGKMRGLGVAVVSLKNGALLHMAPAPDEARAALPFDEKTFSASVTSSRYPYQVAVLAPYAVIWDDVSGLYQRSMYSAIGVGLAFWFLVLYALKPRKARTNEIEAGIERGEFIPFYQPTFDVQTGELMGCEVLIRWRKPDGQILPPGAFIGLAEATGLAIPMTRSLMMNVVDEMEDLHEARPTLKIGINLFDDHFENLDIIYDIKEIFGPSKIAYSQLMFEVTERQPLNDIERARVVIRNMRSLGSKVALDDAGTGHGGLAYLQQLGLDVIKIDKLFIDAIGTDSLSAPIVDSLITLAESLGMDIVAEGVEEPMQVEYLREKGVRLAQGYLFAKPLPGETYKRLIEKMVPLSKRPEQRRRAQIRARSQVAAA
ncbi:MAG: EAL domain-containing protein [Pseudomonadota bacterium]